MFKRKLIWKLFLLLATFATSNNTYAQKLKLGLLVYGGGGDWYANPTSLKNLAMFCNKNLQTNFATDEARIEVSSPELFNYPFFHMTGHGRVSFTTQEAQNLRTYLMAGGFLHIDDNYGMDKYVRPAMKTVFPELDFVEIPFTHPVYHQRYNFANGLPKIHEHDNGQPRAYGLFLEGKLICFYSFECDLGDGWEDPEVHKDPEEKRQLALQMGANLVQYVFMGK